jgi:hypothetical protein
MLSEFINKNAKSEIFYTISLNLLEKSHVIRNYEAPEIPRSCLSLLTPKGGRVHREMTRDREW